jgi:hypothetical protein
LYTTCQAAARRKGSRKKNSEKQRHSAQTTLKKAKEVSNRDAVFSAGNVKGKIWQETKNQGVRFHNSSAVEPTAISLVERATTTVNSKRQPRKKQTNTAENKIKTQLQHHNPSPTLKKQVMNSHNLNNRGK